MNETLNVYGQTGRQSFLWTRDTANAPFALALELLEQQQSGDILAIDMDDIEAIDFSFAAGFFGRLLLRAKSELPGRFVVVQNLQPVARENLGITLVTLDLVIVEAVGGTFELLGKFHPIDLETFRIVLNRDRRLTSRELQSLKHLAANTANERLSKLVDLGVVRRVESVSPAGRREFSYITLA